VHLNITYTSMCMWEHITESILIEHGPCYEAFKKSEDIRTIRITVAHMAKEVQRACDDARTDETFSHLTTPWGNAVAHDWEFIPALVDYLVDINDQDFSTEDTYDDTYTFLELSATK
jgi:hypothetical protein